MALKALRARAKYTPRLWNPGPAVPTKHGGAESMGAATTAGFINFIKIQKKHDELPSGNLT